METLYSFLKDMFFVDTENKVIEDISEAIDIIFHRYVYFMNKENDDVQVRRLLSSGSMVEQTRIWQNLSGDSRDPDIEFDYLAILKPPDREMNFQRTCPGHMGIVMETDVDSGSRCSVDLPNVVTTFWHAFVSALTNMCSCFERKEERCMPFAFTISVIRNERGCDKCTIQMGTGRLRLSFVRPVISADRMYPVKFDWKCVDNTMKAPRIDPHLGICERSLQNILIHADFLPAFDFSIPNTTGNEIFGKKTKNDCFLVPKNCKKHNTCWRISYCLSEVEVLQKTTKSHRDVYILLKIFQSCFKTASGLKSYHIKTAILHHISKCKNDRIDRHHCLVQTIDSLVKGMENRYFPHTIEGLNLRDVFSETSLYLYQSQLFYTVLNYVLGSFGIPNKGAQNTKDGHIIVNAYLRETGNALFETTERVSNGQECFDDFLRELKKLGEWVSKKRPNEYRRPFKENICVIF